MILADAAVQDTGSSNTAPRRPLRTDPIVKASTAIPEFHRLLDSHEIRSLEVREEGLVSPSRPMVPGRSQPFWPCVLIRLRVWTHRMLTRHRHRDRCRFCRPVAVVVVVWWERWSPALAHPRVGWGFVVVVCVRGRSPRAQETDFVAVGDCSERGAFLPSTVDSAGEGTTATSLRGPALGAIWETTTRTKTSVWLGCPSFRL